MGIEFDKKLSCWSKQKIKKLARRTNKEAKTCDIPQLISVDQGEGAVGKVLSLGPFIGGSVDQQNPLPLGCLQRHQTSFTLLSSDIKTLKQQL